MSAALTGASGLGYIGRNSAAAPAARCVTSPRRSPTGARWVVWCRMQRLLQVPVVTGSRHPTVDELRQLGAALAS